MFVFRVLNTVPYSNEAGAKDLIASLHSFFTTNLLVGLAVLVSWKQFGGKPIECMVPTDFTNAWTQYAEQYCWSEQTYFVPFTSTIWTIEDENDQNQIAPTKRDESKTPDGMHFHNEVILEDDFISVEKSPETDKNNGTSTNGRKVHKLKKGGEKVSYYQWMAFFLLFEACCFKLPCFIWKYFARMQVGELLRACSDDNNAVPEVKKANIRALSVHLQGALRFQKRLKKRKLVPHKILRFLNIKYSMYYVTFIYLLAKIAFLVNCVWQTKLLNDYMLPDRGSHFGYDVWMTLWTSNLTWKEHGIFPRVTLCDFEVREMGNIQTFTVQCVLLMNIFLERIFQLLWFWYVILSTFTLCNLLSWMLCVFNHPTKEHFIVNHLEMCADTPYDKPNSDSRAQVDCFIEKYLGIDGVFLLMLIAQHADVVFTTELVGALYTSHYEIEERRTALKQMDRVLPLIVPDSAKKELRELEEAQKGTPGMKRRQSRQASLGTLGKDVKRFISHEDPDLSEVIAVFRLACLHQQQIMRCIFGSSEVATFKLI
ncbi:hypothetical protein WR25_24410 isoform B [Diploscapter pachys]|uniref:Innexin n=1 Tax=Diploscapter pachys TaxID=2018661 RepID=A0A2A2K918_9BILA|nr:hypothetical protein WR25_24410 isoform B [Diploscapter pachys]